MYVLRRIINFKNYLNSVNQLTGVCIQSKSHCYPTKWLISYQCYCNRGFIPNPNKLDVKENTFNHSVLENIPAYSMTVFRPAREPSNVSQGIDKDYFKNSDILNKPIQELLLLFETVCALKSIDSDNVFYVFDTLKKRCHEMDDDQLASVLRNLKHSIVFQTYKRDELTNFWKELDRLCLKRWKTWPVEKSFYFIDLWYCLDLTKRSDFIFTSLMKYLGKPHK